VLYSSFHGALWLVPHPPSSLGHSKRKEGQKVMTDEQEEDVNAEEIGTFV
jgi:hypothetical protein